MLPYLSMPNCSPSPLSSGLGTGKPEFLTKQYKKIKNFVTKLRGSRIQIFDSYLFVITWSFKKKHVTICSVSWPIFFWMLLSYASIHQYPRRRARLEHTCIISFSNVITMMKQSTLNSVFLAANCDRLVVGTALILQFINPKYHEFYKTDG